MREQAARSDPLAELSERERRILELIGEGLTNRKIGERMFPAEKTVKNYVSALFAKLGLERRTQAAVYAARVMHEDESYSGVVMNANCNSNVLLAVDLMPGEPTWHIRPATNMTREMVRDRADHVAVVLVPRADLPSGAESPRPDLMVTGHQGL